MDSKPELLWFYTEWLTTTWTSSGFNWAFGSAPTNSLQSVFPQGIFLVDWTDAGMTSWLVLVVKLHNLKSVSDYLHSIPLITGLIHNTFVQLSLLQPSENFLRLYNQWSVNAHKLGMQKYFAEKQTTFYTRIITSFSSSLGVCRIRSTTLSVRLM